MAARRGKQRAVAIKLARAWRGALINKKEIEMRVNSGDNGASLKSRHALLTNAAIFIACAVRARGRPFLSCIHSNARNGGVTVIFYRKIW